MARSPERVWRVELSSHVTRGASWLTQSDRTHSLVPGRLQARIGMDRPLPLALRTKRPIHIHTGAVHIGLII